MNTLDHNSVAVQIKELRRKSRVILFLSTLWFSAIVLAIATGFRRPVAQEVVDAKQVILRDAENRIMSRLEINADGLPQLIFLDKEGRERMDIGLSNQGGTLSMSNGQGKSVLFLSANEVGSSQIELAQPGGKRLSLVNAGLPESSASISFGDVAGESLTLSLDSHGSIIQMFDRTAVGAARLILHSAQDGTSRITLLVLQRQVVRA